MLALDFSANANVALAYASGLVWPISPPSLKVAFLQFLNPSSDVNSVSSEKGRLKYQQA